MMGPSDPWQGWMVESVMVQTQTWHLDTRERETFIQITDELSKEG